MAKSTTKKITKTETKKAVSSPKISKPIKSEGSTQDSNPLLLDVIIKGMQDKKAQDITIVNLKRLKTGMADYFVICSANTDTQVDAIYLSVEEEVLKHLKTHPWKKEGYQNKEWILLDYSDIVVHIFRSDLREFYSLEQLWGDAEIRNLSPDDIVYLPGEKPNKPLQLMTPKAKVEKTTKAKTGTKKSVATKSDNKKSTSSSSSKAKPATKTKSAGNKSAGAKSGAATKSKSIGTKSTSKKSSTSKKPITSAKSKSSPKSAKPAKGKSVKSAAVKKSAPKKTKK